MVEVATGRVRYVPVEGASELFTPEFTGYLAFLHDRFSPEIDRLLAKRARTLERAHRGERSGGNSSIVSRGFADRRSRTGASARDTSTQFTPRRSSPAAR